MTQASALQRLPEELRWTPQWCIAAEDKRPLSVSKGRLYDASTTDPRGWMDFETALEWAEYFGLGVGYILAPGDDFSCIDLDVKDESNESDPAKWTTQEQFDRYWRIVQHFDSYTEKSRSGKGLHIWVRGKVGAGKKRDGVELYSQARFIICTGDILVDRPIVRKQEDLIKLSEEMTRAHVLRTGELEELEELESDEAIVEKALSASNGDKFLALSNATSDTSKGAKDGSYMQLGYGYATQSEADLALMSIFTFYSPSNEQCRRLFRMTGLGKRAKATQNDKYLNFTLQVIRGRQRREAAIEQSAAAITAEFLARIRPSADHAAPLAATMAANVQPPPLAPEAPVNSLSWPPGLMGAIASFMYQSAPRPVKEVSIVAALGLLAGICGKAFNISQSGLNMYILLVARSAIGKEAMHTGVADLMAAITTRRPEATQFVDFSDFASGPALAKAVAVTPSFVNVAGEFGRKLRRMSAEDGRDGPMQTLRTVMTNLYQKSGPQSIVGGIRYSNKDSNIASVSGVAFSMIGESTPGTLYQALTESMMEDGFLSRFNLVECLTERPARQRGTLLREPPKALGDAIAELCTHSLTLMAQNTSVEVKMSAEAEALMWSFEEECDEFINATLDESRRQMYNRGALKALRIGALLAVADNWLFPEMSASHAKWALEMVRRDIEVMRRRIDSGDVGITDHSRERKLLSIMADYIDEPPSEGYGIPHEMWKEGIVPRKYLQIRCNRVASFGQHRMGASNAMDAALRSLADSGYVQETDKAKTVEKFTFHGKCYRILNLPEELLPKNRVKK